MAVNDVAERLLAALPASAGGDFPSADDDNDDVIQKLDEWSDGLEHALLTDGPKSRRLAALLRAAGLFLRRHSPPPREEIRPPQTTTTMSSKSWTSGATVYAHC